MEIIAAKPEQSPSRNTLVERGLLPRIGPSPPVEPGPGGLGGALSIGGFTASYRILVRMFGAPSRQTVVAVPGDALGVGRAL
jgi:hypothetical protein